MTRVDAFDGPNREERLRARGVTPQQRNLALRNQGYADGRIGKDPTAEQRESPAYMASWRRGREAASRE